MVVKKKPTDGNRAVAPEAIQLPVASAQRFFCDVDRAKHVLNTHFSRIEDRNKWQGPAGIALALILAFVTSDFKKTFEIEAVVWKSVAIVTILFCTYKAAKYAWASRGSKVTSSKIIEDLRNGIEE